MALNTLQDLFIDELKDVYSAEKQILQALPKMAKAAGSPDLRRAFETHRAQTQNQVARLDTIFEQLGASPRGKKCKGMEGLLEEGSERWAAAVSRMGATAAGRTRLPVAVSSGLSSVCAAGARR